MRTPHTSTHRGKQVAIILRDGRQIRDRFLGRTNRWIELEQAGRIYKREIRAFRILKEVPLR